MRKYFSQSGEDYLLWQVFKDAKTGFFVDVGAFDGVHLSNTHSFELSGWQGICVEAHPIFFQMCRNNRPHSTCINAACLDDPSREKISFFAETLGLLSSVERDRGEDVKRRYRNRSLRFEGFQQLEVPATTLNKILTDADFTSQIDFVSIDVEGSELKVLEGFDLRKYSPRVLVIEANDETSEARLDAYLRSQGYLKARKLEANVFYCKTKSDRWILSTTPIDCELEATMHPFGEKYTAERRLKYHTRQSFRSRLRTVLGLPLKKR